LILKPSRTRGAMSSGRVVCTPGSFRRLCLDQILMGVITFVRFRQNKKNRLSKLVGKTLVRQIRRLHRMIFVALFLESKTILVGNGENDVLSEL